MTNKKQKNTTTQGPNGLSPQILYYIGAVWIFVAVFGLAYANVEVIVLVTGIIFVGSLFLSVGAVMQIPMIKGYILKTLASVIVASLLTAALVFAYVFINFVLNVGKL